MDIAVIAIGNSKGIRLSKTMIEKYQIKDCVELIMEKDYMIIKPKTMPRQDWDKAFKRMHKNGDDQSLLPDVFDDENFE
jgi:antitoxin MazE